MYKGVRKKLHILNAVGFLCGFLLWGFFNLIMLMFGMADFYPLSNHFHQNVFVSNSDNFTFFDYFRSMRRMGPHNNSNGHSYIFPILFIK